MPAWRHTLLAAAVLVGIPFAVLLAGRTHPRHRPAAAVTMASLRSRLHGEGYSSIACERTGTAGSRSILVTCTGTRSEESAILVVELDAAEAR
jgi:hypothetical protein